MQARMTVVVLYAKEDGKNRTKRGKTTLTPGGLLKKTVYLETDEREELRRKSYEENRPVSDLIRSLIRQGLALDN